MMNDQDKKDPHYEEDADYEIDHDGDQDGEEFIVDYNDDRNEGGVKENLKDRVVDFVKNNFMYFIVVIILIVPAAMQLKKMFVKPPVQQEVSYDTKLNPVAGATAHKPEASLAANNNSPNAAVSALATPADNAQSLAVQGATNTVPDNAFARTDTVATDNPTDFANVLSSKENDDVDKKLTALDGRLTKLEAMQGQLDGITKSLDSLQTVVNDKTVQQQVTALQSNVDKIGQGMVQLSKAVYQQSVTRQAQAKAGSDETMTQVAANSEQKEDFVVHATIPGRAWLRNRDGALVTVREGDMLPGYGRVTNINPVKGTVSLDTQIVFKEDDNG